MREPDHQAAIAGRAVVSDADVAAAVAAADGRAGRLRERTLEELRRGTLVASPAARVGQVRAPGREAAARLATLADRARAFALPARDAGPGPGTGPTG